MGEKDRCSECGGSIREDRVKTCLWQNGEVFMIEDIPARICEGCFEQFYDEETVLRMDKLRQAGFPRRYLKKIIEVPVFSLPPIKETPSRGKRSGTEIRSRKSGMKKRPKEERKSGKARRRS